MHLFPSLPQFLGLPLPALSFNIMVQKTHKKAEIIQQTITSTRTTWAYNNSIIQVSTKISIHNSSKFVHVLYKRPTSGLVSEPDPRKIETEGLAHRPGWKCTLRPV